MVTFLDPAQEVAKKVRKTMIKKQSKKNTLKIFTSTDPKRFENTLLQIGIKKNVRLLV
jgi:glutamate racemase